MAIKFYLLVAGILLFFSAFSQKTDIQVILKPLAGTQPVNATAELIKLPDSTTVSKIIRTSVVFSVDKQTNYLLRITSTGMQEILQPVSVKDSSVVITVNWKNKATTLGDVIVVSRKPLVRQEDDKTIVDAEVLAESSTNAYEILERVPGAVVDQDGNVYLNSSTPATIQINGREVKLSTADLASLLKSLPANSVLKIELLRTPSAKFDATGSGGIINIVLKKGVKLGTNGSANIGYTQGKYRTLTSGVNINRNRNKVNTYLSYQFTERNNFESLNSQRFISLDTSVISQQLYTTYPSINNYIGGGIDITINDKFSIGYDGRITINNGRSNAFNDNNIYNTYNGISAEWNQAEINTHTNSFYLGNNFSSKYKIDSLGSEWTTVADLNFFKSNTNQIYETLFLLPAEPSINGEGELNNRKNIFALQSDVILKLKNKYTLEAGGKLNISKSKNNSEFFIDSTGVKEIDRSQTNQFRYKETISALYIQVAKTFSGFTIKPGLRMETTNINGQQIFPVDTTLQIIRTDFFPYVYLRRALFKMMGFTLNGNLIYRRSIARPYYEILNPYPRYVDIYLRDIGNANLRPQFTTNYEFNVMADDIPIISLGLNNTKDIFTNVTYQDDSTKIAYRTYDNLGRNKEMYFRVLGGIPPGGKYFFYMGAQHNIVHYTGVYQGEPLDYTRGSWLFFMYQNYRPTPTLNMSLQGFMRVRGFQNFYELENYGSLNLSINKTILNKKGNLILSFNDILQTNRLNFKLDQAAIKAKGLRYNDTRRIGLTFRYNFGIKPKEENGPAFGQPTEGTN